MNSLIRKALISDLDTVKKLTEACAKKMIDDGIFQWNDHYPSKEIFKKDIQEEALYVWDDKIEIKGCIMFSDEKDEVYNSTKWLTQDGKNIYVHRLAVHPKFQKQGIGNKLMNFAESIAKKLNFISIRLDTFSQNKSNNKFYESRGYQKLGDVFFRKQSEFPFHCYEKIIN
tara:strand:+ start:1106 stop:1618 length:513 start_codon:yes stop_codon:yes gene_type:complete